MENLERWEVLRLGAYNIAMVGVLFFAVGSLFNAAMFGVNGADQPLLNLLTDTFHNTGTGTIALAGVLRYYT